MARQTLMTFDAVAISFQGDDYDVCDIIVLTCRLSVSRQMCFELSPYHMSYSVDITFRLMIY